jgi:hypothetical protein
MAPKIQNIGVRKTLQRRPLLGNIEHQLLTVMWAHHDQFLMGTIVEELLETVFYNQSATKRYTASL